MIKQQLEVSALIDKTAIRHAATVVLLRDTYDGPMVLMGQRGTKAAFMPDKFVFPGGALDAEDSEVELTALPDPATLERLANRSAPELVKPLLLAAIREMWEETGHALAQVNAQATPHAQEQPEGWKDFFNRGWIPDASGLQFIFRAITPPGRPRRFDARFFLGSADIIAGDPDDFSNASDELAHLQWIPLEKTREFDLPFVTEVVLAEVQSRLSNPEKSHPVPFFTHEGGRSEFHRL